MRPSEVSEVLSRTIPARLPVLLAGAPGIGKTDVVSQAAEAAGARLLVSHPAVADPTDYKGQPWVVDGRAEFLPFGDLRRLLDATELTVCLLDDLGQAPPAVQAAAMQLLLARRVNDHAVSDSVVFVAASNRRQDKAGVTGILEPVKSRFAAILQLEPDLDDWCAWAWAARIQPEVIQFLRFKPELLHDFQPTTDLVNSPCPRTWAALSRLIGLGFDGPEVLAGAVGQGAATEFLAFLRVWRQLPSPDGILLNPDVGDIPQDPDTLRTLCVALAGKCSDQTGERILRYALRLPSEFSALLVRDAHRRDSVIANAPSFARWATANPNVFK